MMGHRQRQLRFHVWLVVCSTFVWLQTGVVYGEDRLRLLETRVEKIKEDVRALAMRVEELYRNRSCDEVGCEGANYHSCRSELFEPMCNPDGEAFHNPNCGSDASKCSNIYSFERSTILINNELIEGETAEVEKTKESICFTTDLDEFFVDKWTEREQSEIRPYGMYFGSRTGVFRRFPGMRYPDTRCADYDPRLRPWYVAAITGPRNVVLMLDTSSSMGDPEATGNWLKAAAKLIVETLNKSDRIAILKVSKDTRFITDGMEKGSLSSKEIFKRRIDEIVFDGGSNWNNAFQEAFRILNESKENDDMNTRCPVSIVVLTDATSGGNITHIKVGLAQTQNSLEKPIYLFSYTMEPNENQNGWTDDVDDDEMLKMSQIVCSEPNGLSSMVTLDSWMSRMIANSELFSSGLGRDADIPVTVVEPYPFASITINGTTFSAPVFDRSGETPIFLGVVGIDFSMPILLEGTNATEKDFMTYFVDISTMECPKLEQCEVETFRSNDLGECPKNSLCNNSDTNPIAEGNCSYSINLWENENNKNRSYKEAACCNVQIKTRVEPTCPSDSSGGANLKIILPTVLLGFLFAVLAGVALLNNHQEQRSLFDPDRIPPPYNPNTKTETASAHVASAPYDTEDANDMVEDDEDSQSSIPPSKPASTTIGASRVADIAPESAQRETLEDEPWGPE